MKRQNVLTDMLTALKNTKISDYIQTSRTSNANRSDIHFTDINNDFWVIKDLTHSKVTPMLCNKIKKNNKKIINTLTKQTPFNVKFFYVVADSLKNKIGLPITKSKIISLSNFENKLVLHAVNKMNGGNRADVLGPYGERRILNAFINSKNVKIWNNKVSADESYNYPVFKSVLRSKGYQPFNPKNKSGNKIHKITEVLCGSVSQKSPSYCYQLRHLTNNLSGEPKTDVSIRLIIDKHAVNEIHNNSLDDFRISVKTPYNINKANEVHQGSANNIIKNFIQTASPKNPLKSGTKQIVKKNITELKNSLIDLENNKGAASKLSKRHQLFMQNHIRYLNKWLLGYAISGKNDMRQSGIQIANTLCVFNPNNGELNSYSMKNIFNRLMKNIPSKLRKMKMNNKLFSYGSPFNWTYKKLSNKKAKKSKHKYDLQLRITFPH